MVSFIHKIGDFIFNYIFCKVALFFILLIHFLIHFSFINNILACIYILQHRAWVQELGPLHMGWVPAEYHS